VGPKIFNKIVPCNFLPGGGWWAVGGEVFFFKLYLVWRMVWRMGSGLSMQVLFGRGGGGFIFLSANAKAQGALLLFLFKFGGWVRRFGCAFFGLRV
jgi:hypothetical protein